MIQSVAEERSIVRTGFLWECWSERQAATWVMIPASHEVAILGDWFGAQGALDTKAFYKTDDIYSYFGVLK